MVALCVDLTSLLSGLKESHMPEEEMVADANSEVVAEEWG